jgi:hypothetical protein
MRDINDDPRLRICVHDSVQEHLGVCFFGDLLWRKYQNLTIRLQKIV